MSFKQYFEITCDFCGLVSPHAEHFSAHDYRNALELAGWRCGLLGSRDACPKCAVRQKSERADLAAQRKEARRSAKRHAGGLFKETP